MVVVHRADGFRFVIYTVDHEPAHVHITGPGQAKINLLGADGMPALVSSVNIKALEMQRLMSEVAKYRDGFLQQWEHIHGRCDRR